MLETRTGCHPASPSKLHVGFMTWLVSPASFKSEAPSVQPHSHSLQVPRVEQAPPPPPSRSASHSKASFLSPTPSFEADDECSVSDPSNMESHPEAPTHTRDAHYPGEDTRLTSKKELFGWYSYGWAAEVFVICGVGTYQTAILLHSSE